MSNTTTTTLIALGADLKSGYALLNGEDLYVSDAFGDLMVLNNYETFENSLLQKLKFSDKVNKVAVDKHPSYMSKDIGEKLAEEYNCELVEVQHHLAHGLSVMSEYSLEKAIALCFDGTGYGEDGNIWGAECFTIDLQERSWQRVSSLTPSSLIGGEKSILEPKRQVLARMKECNLALDEDLESLSSLLIGENSKFPSSHSAGRLFDAIGAMLIPEVATIEHEAQAAIALESKAQACVDKNKCVPYEVVFKDNFICANSIFKDVYEDLKNGVNIEKIAYTFHLTMCEVIIQMVKKALKNFNSKNICISGGVFQNKLLTGLVEKAVKSMGWQFYCNQVTPIHDGNVCIGQIYYMRHFL